MSELRQSVAEDVAYLVETFRHGNVPGVRAAYQMMVKVFQQQCEVVGERVAVRKHPGGDIVCNPSDPEATLDGHKGSGYQVQLSETCSADNEVQLIVSAIPETACQTDSAALEVVIEDLKKSEFKPSEMTADTAYGGIESTNSLLKRVFGLGRLRVRRQKSVFMSIYLKVAGWNILRAASARSVIEKLKKSGQIASSAQHSSTLSKLRGLRPFAAAA